MSSHPSSAFKSGMNRVMGTVMGAVFGLAVTQWLPIRQPGLIVLVLTLWVFVCAFNRGSATYGEVAVSAALTVRHGTARALSSCSCYRCLPTPYQHTTHTPPLTHTLSPSQAPIVVVGPVVGSSGAVVRISQVILGTVIYVVVDNLFFPVRAKLLLRAQLCESVRDVLHLCREGLAPFLREVSERKEGPADWLVGWTRLGWASYRVVADTALLPNRQPDPHAGSVVEADINELDAPEKIRSALQKEALFIALATGQCIGMR